MGRDKVILKALLSLAVAGLVLAGCGSGGGETPGYSKANFEKRDPPPGFMAAHANDGPPPAKK